MTQLAATPKRSLTARLRKHGRALVAAVPLGWLLLFFLVPFAIVLKISVAEAILAMPPYTPLVQWVDGQFLQLRLDIENFLFLFEDSLYWSAYLNSVKVAAISTVFCLFIGYPMAYGIARARPCLRRRAASERLAGAAASVIRSAPRRWSSASARTRARPSSRARCGA